MTWGFNLLAGNVNNTVAAAKAMLYAFSRYGPASRAGVILDNIEIGNEADLYKLSNWTVSSYASQYVESRYLSSIPSSHYTFRWKQFAGQLVWQAGLNPGRAPRLLVGSFAANSNSSADSFNPPNLFRAGILNGSYFGSFVNT